MANGLMSLLEGGLSGLTEERFGKIDREKQQIEDAFKDKDDFYNNMVTSTMNIVNNNYSRIGEKPLDAADNFDRILNEYGQDKLEELNLLARSRPFLFEGNFKEVKNNVEKFLLSPTLPDISPEGVTRVRDVQTEGGYRTIDQTAPQEILGTSTSEIWRNNYKSMVTNVQESLADAAGPNSAKLMVGDFIPGEGAQERFESRKMYEEFRGEDMMTTDEFVKNQTSIAQRKLYEQPSALSSQDFLRVVNFVDMPTYDTMFNGYMQEYRGNAQAAELSTLTDAIYYRDKLKTQGYFGEDGEPDELVRMGVIPNNTIIGIITRDPAAQIAEKRLIEKVAVDQNLQQMKFAYDQYKQDPEGYINSNGEEAAATALSNWENVTEQTYQEAVALVGQTGYYDIEKKFLSAYSPIDYPDYTKVNTKEYGEIVIYPISAEGYVKILDAKNPNPNEPLDFFKVENITKIERGGNPNKELNIYYKPELGYNVQTNSNPQFDQLNAILDINDPFNLNRKLGAPIQELPIVPGADLKLEEEKEEEEKQSRFEKDGQPYELTKTEQKKFSKTGVLPEGVTDVGGPKTFSEIFDMGAETFEKNGKPYKLTRKQMRDYQATGELPEGVTVAE